MKYIVSISLLIMIPYFLLAQDAGNKEVMSLSAKEKAQYPGGEKELEKYLSLNLRYPNKALENRITGEVVVCFMLDEKGIISDVRVLKSLGYGCDEEAIRVVEKMPAWKPAQVHGEAVKVNYILPVVFGSATDKQSADND